MFFGYYKKLIYFNVARILKAYLSLFIKKFCVLTKICQLDTVKTDTKSKHKTFNLSETFTDLK